MIKTMFKNVKKTVKYIVILSIIVNIIVLCYIALLRYNVSACGGYTYEGKFNPNDFTHWEVVKSWEKELIKKHKNIKIKVETYIYIHKNPDSSSIVKKIKAYYVLDRLTIYRYFKNSTSYEFMFDDDLNKYMQIPLSKGNKARCYRCHNFNDPTKVDQYLMK